AGGMNGGIDLVIHRATDRLCIEKHSTQKDVVTGYARNEIECLRQVGHHPHINTLVDCWIDYEEQKASIYLEYCVYGSLAKRIRRHIKGNRRFNEVIIWNWWYQLTDALSYCHHGPDPENQTDWNWILHLDIKPDNIFLFSEEGENRTTREAIVQLGDFGLAITKETTDRGIVSPEKGPLGHTPGWMAPEYYRPKGQPKYSAKSDIWTLAAVIVCVCRLTERLDPHFNRNNPAGSQYSPELNQILSQCLAHNPNERPDSFRLRDMLHREYV
ncbi:kinase-like protein, partial [Amniculicola lignicola CBS 123094]